MDEKQFIQDLWDLMCGHTEYITQEQFTKKYFDYFVGVNRNRGYISLMDDHNDWRFTLQKTWTEKPNS